MDGMDVSFGCVSVTVRRIGGGITTSAKRVGGITTTLTKKCGMTASVKRIGGMVTTLTKKGGMTVTAALICATDQGTRYLRVTPENPQTFHWISYTNEIVYDVQSNVNWDIS